MRFTVTPTSGTSISAIGSSFDATAHLRAWNQDATDPPFYYPTAGTFAPLVQLTDTDGSSETLRHAGSTQAT